MSDAMKAPERDDFEAALAAARPPAPRAPEVPAGGLRRLLGALELVPRTALRAPILIYRYTLSSFMGRQCRYLPTCSQYADEAIRRHGAYAGFFMATARICRCNPWGGHGYDPVPGRLPEGGHPLAPWRYGVWRYRGGPCPCEDDAREPAEP
ncbi:membrane protein insertion efficiency factor YidD [Xanthobacter pseudotagetidis]|uniref:membrane protein insertion efficiency factor YidD n=1 Tax=Xanthobacter pseudotagetidis TaxID=3119911 RepID=UPI0037266BE8